MNSESTPNTSNETSRRDFLQKIGTLAVASGVAANAAPLPPMPMVRFGKHLVSRLIVGSNTFSSNSHLSSMIDVEMREWHTPERIVQIFKHCEELGINCNESGRRVPQYNAEHGGKMLFTLRAPV
jgi:hypothetical protein